MVKQWKYSTMSGVYIHTYTLGVCSWHGIIFHTICYNYAPIMLWLALIVLNELPHIIHLMSTPAVMSHNVIWQHQQIIMLRVPLGLMKLGSITNIRDLYAVRYVGGRVQRERLLMGTWTANQHNCLCVHETWLISIWCHLVSLYMCTQRAIKTHSWIISRPAYVTTQSLRLPLYKKITHTHMHVTRWMVRCICTCIIIYTAYSLPRSVPRLLYCLVAQWIHRGIVWEGES